MYQFKNKFCPNCKLPIDGYFYKFNKKNEKIHIECEKNNNDVIGEKKVYVGDESS